MLYNLPLEASRGDQILNAQYFERHGYAVHLPQSEGTPQKLVDTVRALYEDRQRYIDAMSRAAQSNAIDIICGLITSCSNVT